MSQPPIVPGPDDPYYQPQPYSPPPAYQPAPPPPLVRPTDVVGKTALSTVVVVATLFVLFCVLPMALCAGCGALGSLSG